MDDFPYVLFTILLAILLFCVFMVGFDRGQVDGAIKATTGTITCVLEKQPNQESLWVCTDDLGIIL